MKILIDSKHGLGDCVQIIPMLSILKENYPDSYIAVIVSSKANAELLAMAPVAIDKFYYLNMQQINIKSFIKLIYQIRKEKIDYFIISPITTKWKAKLFACLTGAKNKIGEQYHNINLHEVDNTVHMVKRNINLLKEFCKIPDKIINPILKVPQIDNFILTKKDKKIIGVCIGAGTGCKYKNKIVYPKSWSVEKIKIVVRNLLKNNAEVVLFGGKDELQYLNYFNELLDNKNILNFVGKTTITESAFLAKQCDLVIGVDTGMQHITDAVGTKTLSIFGPTNPKIFGAYSNNAKFIEVECSCKYCYGTEQYLSCNDKKCLNDISDNNVINKIKSILGI